jgi:predicted nucleotide-binding protein (sugar kinase/HSP70/actin superfamily)
MTRIRIISVYYPLYYYYYYSLGSEVFVSLATEESEFGWMWFVEEICFG